MQNRRLAITLAAAMSVPWSASAGTIAFDDAWAALGQGGDPATFYLASDGVTFNSDYFGLVGGIGNGDPGNWNLEGTNGSAFLGVHPSDVPLVSFAADVSSVSLDVGLGEYGSPSLIFNNDFTIEALLDGNVVSTQTFNLTTSGVDGDGIWQTVTFSGGLFDSVRASSVQNNPTINVFGIDNIVFETAVAAPEPAVLALVGFGLAGFGIARRRRKP